MFNLAFFRDILPAGATLDLPAGPHRVLFGWQGKLSVRAAGAVATLSSNSAWHGAMAAAATAGKEGAAAGEPWFESGPDPVLAHASESAQTSFARVMILPAALLGKSSIRYVLPEDQDKPKRQTYQLFIDEPLRPS